MIAVLLLCRMAAENDPLPSPESFKGIGTSLEATGGNGENLDHLRQAVEAYRNALDKTRREASILFYMGVALERLGETEESEQILELIQRSEAHTSCMNDSWGYVRYVEGTILNRKLASFPSSETFAKSSLHL